ncbi:MAG: hypothetical protein ACUVUD_06715 [bacterium]
MFSWRLVQVDAPEGWGKGILEEPSSGWSDKELFGLGLFCSGCLTDQHPALTGILA